MVLTLTDISKSYGKNTVLSHISYSFPSTGCYAILAPSGKGKTTLLRVISGLETPSSGSVSAPHRISVLFQEHRLFENLTALDNVLLIGGNAEDALSLLLHFGFTEEQTKLYPDALSGGMKQRVALCRAFLYSAPMLLLDEPCKELDKALTDAVYERITQEAENRLVILTVHSEDEAKRCRATIIRL